MSSRNAPAATSQKVSAVVSKKVPKGTFFDSLHSSELRSVNLCLPVFCLTQ
jgi:hypothetical protein